MNRLMQNAVLPTIVAVFLAMLAIPALAGDRIGPIEITVQPLATVDNTSGAARGTRHGYLEYRVQLRNLSSKDLTIELSQDRRPGMAYGVSVSRTVRVAAGQEVAVSLFQPSLSMSGTFLIVRVEGVDDPKTIFIQTPVDRSYDDNPRCAILTSRSVPQEFREPRATTHAAPAASPGTEPYVFLRSELPVKLWSANWLGYSCYDAIVVTEKDVEEMPPQVQLALRRYIECGGVLLVHAPTVPLVFADGGSSDGHGGYFIGFGRAVAEGDGSRSDWQATRAKLATAGLHEYRPVQKPSDPHGLLIGETTVPIRGLFVLVLVFGICIGPANLWILSRYKRRIWLWWNVPAISLLTCLVVFAYSLASEGITGRGRVATLTVLDERCHRATTIGYISYYCPLTPSVGPQFGVDTDVTLLPNRGYRGSNDANSHLIDWTNNQFLASGWVNARVPAYFQIRKNEDRRERLDVEPQDDGSLKVVNALGADIQQLYLADASGRIFETRNLPAGAERLLTKPRSGKKAGSANRSAGLRNVFASAEWLTPLGIIRATNDPPGSLGPGDYIAILNKSPFVETPLENINSEDTSAIVCGVSKGAGNGR